MELRRDSIIAVIIAVVFWMIGCGGESPESVPSPFQRLSGTMISWKAEGLLGPIVRESLDGRWEKLEGLEIGEDASLFFVSLSKRVDFDGMVAEATAIANGRRTDLAVYHGLECLKDDLFQPDDPHRQSRLSRVIEGLEPGALYIDCESRRNSRLQPETGTEALSRCVSWLREGPVQIVFQTRAFPARESEANVLLRLNGKCIGAFTDSPALKGKSCLPYILQASAQDAVNTLELELLGTPEEVANSNLSYQRYVQFSQSAGIYTLCSAGRRPPPGLSVEYREKVPVLNEYELRKMVPDAVDLPFPWAYYRVGQETRPSISLPAQGEIEFEVSLPGRENSLRLSFGVASPVGFHSTDMQVFEVRIASASPQKVKSERVEIGGGIGANSGRWLDREIDLESFGPGKVAIHILSRSEPASERPGPGGSEGLFAFLAEPMVISRRAHRQLPRRNIILVSLDTLRADHLGCYGYSRGTSPALDRFAAGSTRFTNAIAQSPWTLPSHATLLTGLYASEHGLLDNWDRLRMAGTVASYLRECGYQTKAIVDGLYLDPSYGLCIGFESYEDHQMLGFQTILPAAEAWLTEEAREPFFLFVHTYDAHAPYSAPTEYRDRFDLPAGVSPELIEGIPDEFVGTRASPQFLAKNPVSEADAQHIINMYDAEIMYVDDCMDSLFSRLKDLGYWEDSLIVVTSDHGEEFFDHGGLAHGHTLYEEVIRVPLLVRYPGGPAGGVKDEVVELADIPSTLMDFAGLGAAVCQGRESLLAGVRNTQGAKPVAYSELTIAHKRNEKPLAVAQRTSSQSFIYYPSSERGEYYDLQKDPKQQSDVAAEHPEEVKRLASEVTDFLQENSRRRKDFQAASMELSEEMMQNLRDLGYLK